ncbi:MFS transporter [Iodobacter ciconiae]|uniref:MFS transporter n=1 Tax=Iodobacter ciconiae TaxID=2496266 RepID=A0A3S8ZQP8_9NEIS|nr:MFS transporter [Iodobacter ciconiae]AZN35798.1 MFS transporter [Iodobacter ciconiae]
MLRHHLKKVTYAVAALFFALGFNYGSWASRLPAIKLQLNLDPAQVGFLLLAAGLGAVFSFPVTTAALQRFGSKKVCLGAGLALPLVLPALAFAPNYGFALVIMVFEGVAHSCLNVAMNAQGVAVELESGQPIMSRLHAVFSLGGLAAALFASLMTGVSPDLSLHLCIVAVLIWGAVLWASSRLLVDRPESAAAGGKHFSLPTGVAVLLGLIALFGTIVEGSMVDWTALYLRNDLNAEQWIAPLGLASFSGAMLLARWFGDGWRTRWGSRKLLFAGSGFAGMGLLLGLAIGGVIPSLIAFAVVGLGVAAVSPCVYMAAARQGAVALAAVTTMGSIGALMGPPMIGFIAHTSSLTWGLVFVAMGALVIAILVRKMTWPA